MTEREYQETWFREPLDGSILPEAFKRTPPVHYEDHEWPRPTRDPESKGRRRERDIAEVRVASEDGRLLSLNTVERRILEARFLSERAVPLRELGKELGRSRERVRQVQVRALVKLRTVHS